MNYRDLFTSMRSQLVPSPEARAALREKLAGPMKKPVPWRRYAAAAACAALIIAAVPLWQVWQEHRRWERFLENFHHDAVAEPFVESTASGAGDQDQDQEMTPDELANAMADAGFSREDVDTYAAEGWQMTWASWWKFVHLSEETGDRTLAALREFSRKNCVTVVELPGAFVEEDASSVNSGGYVHIPAPADAANAEPITPDE